MLSLSKLALAGSTLLFTLAPQAPDLKLKENDHKNLGKLVSAYFEATDEKKGISEALEKVLAQIEATDKRLKNQKCLASAADWEQVFRLVAEGRLKETLKKKGEVTAVKTKSDIGVELSFAYCTPKKPVKGALPLILIACDSGEAPVAHLNAWWSDPLLRESAFLVALDMGKDTASWGIFGTQEAPGGVYTVMGALGTILKEFPVDANRTFLVGSGKGFAAVETTAASFPQTFAGLIGLGDVSANDLGSYENFRNLPSLFPKECEGTVAIKARIDQLGYGNCTLSAKSVEGAETKTDGTPAETWEWIGKNVRSSYPAQLTFAPRSDFARGTHWISLSGIQASEGPRLEAKAERADNVITIDATKVGSVVIYLNDELVDMSKPVRFVINGKTFERTVERSAPEMIKNQYNLGDWGRVFTAAVIQEVPAK